MHFSPTLHFVSVLVALLSQACLYGQIQADESQGKLPLSMSLAEAVTRMAVERETLVQFAVTCKVSGRLGSPFQRADSAGQTSKRSEFNFEYSRVEKHTVVIFRSFFKGEENSGVPWRVIGLSRDCMFASRGKDLNVNPRDESLQPFIASDREFPAFFDPRATGLGSYGDLQIGASFEKLCSNMLNWKIAAKKLRLNDDNLLILDAPHSGVALSIDPQRDYWPVRFKFAPTRNGYSEWRTKIGSHLGKAVPVSASLVDVRGDERKEITFEFDWETINEPFPTGAKAALRIADVYGLKFNDRR